jgi:hypothetical protein
MHVAPTVGRHGRYTRIGNPDKGSLNRHLPNRTPLSTQQMRGVARGGNCNKIRYWTRQPQKSSESSESGCSAATSVCYAAMVERMRTSNNFDPISDARLHTGRISIMRWAGRKRPLANNDNCWVEYLSSLNSSLERQPVRLRGRIDDVQLPGLTPASSPCVAQHERNRSVLPARSFNLRRRTSPKLRLV